MTDSRASPKHLSHDDSKPIFSAASSLEFSETGSPSIVGANPIAAHRIDAGQRIAEIGQILAAGFMRYRHRQSTQALRNKGESLLDLSADQSVYATRRAKV